MKLPFGRRRTQRSVRAGAARPGQTRPAASASKTSKTSKTTKRPERGRGAMKVRRGSVRPGRQARRPGPPWRRRLRIRLPSLARFGGALLAAAAAAAIVALVNGPWLRVAEVSWAGERYTETGDLAAALDGLEGMSLLTVDGDALASEIERLPAVADARVAATVPGGVTATVIERQPAFVWQTRSARLVGAEDGRVIAALPLEEALPPDLDRLPFVDDARPLSRLLAVGDVLRPDFVATALRLAALDPALLGSRADRLTLRLEEEYGFLLVSSDPAWRAAFGFYGLDPSDTPERIGARVERQVAAVRTLFASRGETAVAWVDARNPGKVYFRAEG